jgi:glycerophosphoryl diester phosphodiesterase/PKD repeat protein
MKFINKLLATLLSLLLLATVGCKDDWDENSLTSKFAFDKSEYMVGDVVTIVNQTMGGSGSYTYEWEFGDPAVPNSTETSPTVTYAESGSYVVTLHVRDSKGRYAKSNKLVVISPEPLPEVGNVQLKWVSASTLGQIRSVAPAVALDGSVYMTSEDHILHKYDGQTGAELWAYDLWSADDGVLPKGNTHSTPSIDEDGTIFVGTGNTSGSVGRVYAFNPDGTKKWVMSNDPDYGFWNANGGAAIPRIHYLTCAITESSIYVGNAGTTGSTLSVDKSNGHRRGYFTQTSGSSGPTGGVSCGVIVDNDKLIWTGSKNGLFGGSRTAVDAGPTSDYWQKLNDSGTTKATQDMNASLAIDATGYIYGIATQADLGGVAYCVSPAGEVMWRTALGNVGSLDQSGVVIGLDGNIIVTTKTASGEATGGVVSLTPSGSINWQYGIGENVSGVAAIDQAGNIHFGTESGNYYIIRPEASDDQLILKKDVAALIAESASPYAADWEAGCAKIWSSPTIGPDGTIYIGVTNTNDNEKSVVIALEDEAITGAGNTPWPMKGGNCRHTNCHIDGNSSSTSTINTGNTQMAISGNLYKDLKNQSTYKVWMVAHRGNTYEGYNAGVPENSLAAVDAAIKGGAEMIEIDVRETKDGELVVCHDETVDRTVVGLSGKVADLTLAEIQAHNLKGLLGETTEKMPTLKAMLERGKGKIYYNLDRCNSADVNKVNNLLKELDMVKQVVVYVSSSFDAFTSYFNTNSNLLVHMWATNTTQLDKYVAYPDNIQIVQIDPSAAATGTIAAEVTSRGFFPYTNTLTSGSITTDSDMLQGDFSTVDALVANKVVFLQSNYCDVLGAYLKGLGLR